MFVASTSIILLVISSKLHIHIAATDAAVLIGYDFSHNFLSIGIIGRQKIRAIKIKYSLFTIVILSYSAQQINSLLSR